MVVLDQAMKVAVTWGPAHKVMGTVLPTQNLALGAFAQAADVEV